MARHIMAVCVVCLLCADHVRCKQHFTGADQAPSVERTQYDRTINPAFDHEQHWLPYGEYDAPLNGDHRIVKRHHSHGSEEKNHGEDEVEEERAEFERKLNPMVKEFVMKIFAEFGNPETMQMDGKGFERMMDRLGLYQMIGGEAGAKITTNSGGDVSEATESNRQLQNSVKCLSSNDFLRRVTNVKVPSEEWHKEEHTVSKDSAADDNNDTQQHNSSDHSLQSNTSVSNESNSNTNSSNNDHPIDDHHHHHHEEEEEPSESTARNASQHRGTSRLDSRDLYNVCPLILSRLLSEEPLARAGCFTPDSVPELQVRSSQHTHHHHDGDSHELAVWVYSFLAILGVSLCGLLGVVVIPCMDKHFYHHALQFLVALAVGTLCGDALLHLLPHAMFPDGLSLENAHDQMMYKGLAAVFGIVFFYFMERLLTMIAEWYKGREKKDKPSSRVRVMRDPESNSLHLAAGNGEKQCKHKYSAYPYCYDEIAMDTKDDHHEHNQVNENHNNVLAKCANSHGDEQQQQQQPHHGNEHIPLNHNNSTTSVANNHHRSGGTSHDETIHTTSNSIDNNTVSSNLDDGSIESGEPQTVVPLKTEATKKLRKENYTIILREHETKHHGHSHTHGHVHSPPGSLSAVVWMVIMGDGLHNFTDGMTIGAAFANNIAGGFSTAIAVFCHELPHELGDFAVLLKAGMSAREAVFYNLLSSVLSIFGMILGIMVGHQPQASAWIFALAAGMFLYIAMVDMIPELTSSHGAEERCKLSDFGLQLLGLVVGFGIMLLIAMYEHDLMEIFVH